MSFIVTWPKANNTNLSGFSPKCLAASIHRKGRKKILLQLQPLFLQGCQDSLGNILSSWDSTYCATSCSTALRNWHWDPKEKPDWLNYQLTLHCMDTWVRKTYKVHRKIEKKKSVQQQKPTFSKGNLSPFKCCAYCINCVNFSSSKFCKFT